MDKAFVIPNVGATAACIMSDEEEPPPLEEQVIDSDSDSDDDDEPPSLETLSLKNDGTENASASAPKDPPAKVNAENEDDEGPTLRDLMQQEAEVEEKKKAARQAKEQKRMAKSFGKGFKLKGFFNKKKKKTAKTTTKNKPAPKNPDLPYVSKSDGNEEDLNGLRLPEVQEALKNA